jgi:hypothetical protein
VVKAVGIIEIRDEKQVFMKRLYRRHSIPGYCMTKQEEMAFETL